MWLALTAQRFGNSGGFIPKDLSFPRNPEGFEVILEEQIPVFHPFLDPRTSQDQERSIFGAFPGKSRAKNSPIYWEKNSHTAQLAQASEGSSGISREYPPKASILGIKAPRLRLERRFGILGSPGSFPLSGIPAWLSRSRLFQGFFFGITAKLNPQWHLLLGAFPGI